MPFGLANAPATFQSYINQAMSDLLDTCCVVYLDDIVIYSDSAEEHVYQVQEVLTRLRKHRLYAKHSKCEFHTTEINFLGFNISTKGIKIEPSRVTTIVEWLEPQNIREVQQFLGFANFYRRFIEHYSKITASLTNLTKGHTTKGGKRCAQLPPKGEGKFLTKEAKEAFEELKQRFISAPILCHFDLKRKSRIEPDASKAVIAGIFTQL
jgi:hypothetical protein